MASGKSNYLGNALLDGRLGGPAFNLPATVYIALSTAVWSASVTGSTVVEPSGGAYARVAKTNDATNFPAASGRAKSNGTAITFPAASADWGTIQSFYIVDAASGGNILDGGDLTTPRAVTTGDTASFAPGALDVLEN